MDQVYAHTMQSGMASVASAITACALGEQPKLRLIEGGQPDGEGIKRGVNLGLVAGVQCTCDRFSDIAADERFAEHLDDPGGLRQFAQLRATVAAHQND